MENTKGKVFEVMEKTIAKGAKGDLQGGQTMENREQRTGELLTKMCEAATGEGTKAAVKQCVPAETKKGLGEGCRKGDRRDQSLYGRKKTKQHQ